MAANSHTSSMSAQNGSSYSSSIYPSDLASQTARQGSSYPTAGSAAQARHPSGQRPIRNHRTHELENGHGSAYPAPVGDEQAVYDQSTNAYSAQNYYLSSPGYCPPGEPATYENELDFDEDQNDASQSSSGYRQPSHPDSGQAYIPPTSVAQQYSSQQITSTDPVYATSETTQMWTAQQSPEERLRLGLPRHLPGQQTREYQQAASRYESSHRSRR